MRFPIQRWRERVLIRLGGISLVYILHQLRVGQAWRRIFEVVVDLVNNGLRKGQRNGGEWAEWDAKLAADVFVIKHPQDPACGVCAFVGGTEVHQAEHPIDEYFDFGLAQFLSPDCGAMGFKCIEDNGAAFVIGHRLFSLRAAFWPRSQRARIRLCAGPSGIPKGGGLYSINRGSVS